jgi:hypothetical protein
LNHVEVISGADEFMNFYDVGRIYDLKNDELTDHRVPPRLRFLGCALSQILCGSLLASVDGHLSSLGILMTKFVDSGLGTFT